MRRVTINDVAQRAGVSKGAASFALNGRPGVSEATRERVLLAAQELGWVPNAAAKALSHGRSHTVGLVMNRPARLHGIEPLIQHFLEGVQDELSAHGISLLIQVVQGHDSELATFKDWALGSRVDGVVVIDLRVGDDRPRVLHELGLPAVFLGDPRFTDSLPAVWVDERVAATALVRHLHERGHRRIVRVGDRALLAHAAVRTEAFTDACEGIGLEAVTVNASGSRAECADMVRSLLTTGDRPTALLFENDVKAVVGMSVIHELGLTVPGDVAVCAWEETGFADVLTPALTTASRDGRAEGARAVRLLLDTLSGTTPSDPRAPDPTLVVRRSTDPA